VELLEEIGGESPSEEVIKVVRKRGIKIIHFPVDARLDPSVPDMQFGQRLLRDAPCDVVVTDPGEEERTSLRRIVVPMDLTTSGQVARYICQVGTTYGLDVVPLHISAGFGADSQTIAQRELDLQLAEGGIDTNHPWMVPQLTIAEGLNLVVMGRSGSGHSKRVRITLSTSNPVPASMLEEIRTAAKAIQGEDTPVEVNVFQNAVQPATQVNTQLDTDDSSMRK
jgi:hypothetical protein